LPHERGALGLPAGGNIEEVEIGGGGDDADLDEIEDVDPIDARRFTAGEREQHHDDGSGPKKVEDIGRPGHLCCAGDETFVVRTDNLRDGV